MRNKKVGKENEKEEKKKKLSHDGVRSNGEVPTSFL